MNYYDFVMNVQLYKLRTSSRVLQIPDPAFNPHKLIAPPMTRTTHFNGILES